MSDIKRGIFSGRDQSLLTALLAKFDPNHTIIDSPKRDSETNARKAQLWMRVLHGFNLKSDLEEPVSQKQLRKLYGNLKYEHRQRQKNKEGPRGARMKSEGSDIWDVSYSPRSDLMDDANEDTQEVNNKCKSFDLHLTTLDPLETNISDVYYEPNAEEETIVSFDADSPTTFRECSRSRMETRDPVPTVQIFQGSSSTSKTKVGPKSMPEDAEIMMAHQQTEEARKAEKHAEEMKLLRAQVEATNMWRDAAISICGIGKAIETFLSSKS
ncbi:uncharacterized protein LOC131892736 [Tigriopus californicus]|uniref:uncharacterized protein LOC131892736 n=1 Tax=Tigriopus californicus TaxID=6832 RepID=UPI0027DA1821|nr:uncharacterized protein LOC131892736 [Tigriopus californicus]